MMDAFEENLQTFIGTIYGSEMRDSLGRCFTLLLSEIKYYDEKIREIGSKINNLEERD